MSLSYVSLFTFFCCIGLFRPRFLFSFFFFLGGGGGLVIFIKVVVVNVNGDVAAAVAATTAAAVAAAGAVVVVVVAVVVVVVVMAAAVVVVLFLLFYNYCWLLPNRTCCFVLQAESYLHFCMSRSQDQKQSLYCHLHYAYVNFSMPTLHRHHSYSCSH